MIVIEYISIIFKWPVAFVIDIMYALLWIFLVWLDENFSLRGEVKRIFASNIDVWSNPYSTVRIFPIFLLHADHFYLTGVLITPHTI